MFNKETSHRRIPKPVKVLFFGAFIALAGFALGHVIMFLWNEVLVEATDVKPLSFWQAIGLFVLSRILFGGFRFGERSKKWRAKKARWKGKWQSMSEDERELFKQKWRERCSKKFSKE